MKTERKKEWGIVKHHAAIDIDFYKFFKLIFSNCILLKMIIIAMITNCIFNINNRTACATLNVVKENGINVIVISIISFKSNKLEKF